MEDTLPGCLKYHLTSGKYDCYFVFDTENGAKEKVGAKKQLLMAYSETFQRMLEESPIAEKDDVHLKDIKIETFKNLLKFVYGGGVSVLVSMSAEELVDLLFVAEKYLIEDLKPKVATLISDRISVNNICYVISSPVCLQNEDLEGEISDFICIEIEKVLKTKDFLELESKLVLWILKQPSLNVSEIRLWEALLEWSRNKFRTKDKKELRSNLLEHLKYIRFGSMSTDELCKQVVTSDILLPEEVVQAIKLSNGGQAIQLDSLCFDVQPRKKILGKTKFVYVLNNINDFKKPYVSQNFEVCWLQYKIEIEKCGDYFSFWLSRDSNKKTLKWKTSFECKMCLLNQGGKENVVDRFSRDNSVADKRYGYTEFFEISKCVDPKNGFIMNNGITVMIDVKITDIVK